MRTTIDLPDDLHRILLSVARDEGRTLNQVVAQLLRRTLTPGGSPVFDTDRRTGLPVIRIGRVITSDDVRSVEDEEP
jgi:outer membrane lipopolysaccharide assembly protein LptE/RlpB